MKYLIIGLNFLVENPQPTPPAPFPWKIPSPHWLINYIPDPIRKSLCSFKEKNVSLFNTNTPKETVYGEGNKPSEAKSQKIEII